MTAVASASLPAPLLDVQGVTLQYKTKDHLVTATYASTARYSVPTGS